MTTNDVSLIFSLADEVEITSQGVNTFERLGTAHDGYHVAVFFRPVVQAMLLIDHKNPMVLNRFCTMYNFVNRRGTVYGHLFVVDATKLEINDNRLVVRCNVREKYDFETLTLSSEKTKLLFFKSSSGCLLVLSAGNENSEYLVREA